MMGPVMLWRKFVRNVRDYGWWRALTKSGTYLVSPLVYRSAYTIYAIDLHAPPATRSVPQNDLDYVLLNVHDEALIDQVERSAEWLHGKVRSRLADGAVCLAAVKEGKLAGFNLIAFHEAYIPLLRLTRTFRPGTAWSDHIAVARPFRRGGVAQSLRLRTFEELRRRGIRKLYGGSLSTNAAALELAQRLGFREVAEATCSEARALEVVALQTPPPAAGGRPCGRCRGARRPAIPQTSPPPDSQRKSRSPRVLMLLENACYPHNPRVRREAQTLLSAGCEVSVICPADKGQPRREVIDGVHLYRFRSLTAGDGLLGYLCEYGYTMIAASVLSLVVLFRRGFNVVHAHNPPDLFVLIGMMYKLLGKRFVFDHHNLSPEMSYAAVPRQEQPPRAPGAAAVRATFVPRGRPGDRHQQFLQGRRAGAQRNSRRSHHRGPQRARAGALSGRLARSAATPQSGHDHRLRGPDERPGRHRLSPQGDQAPRRTTWGGPTSTACWSARARPGKVCGDSAASSAWTTTCGSPGTCPSPTCGATWPRPTSLSPPIRKTTSPTARRCSR